MDSLILSQFRRITGSPVTCPAVEFGLSIKHHFSLEQALNPIKLLVTPITFKPLLQQRVHLAWISYSYYYSSQSSHWGKNTNVLRA